MLSFSPIIFLIESNIRICRCSQNTFFFFCQLACHDNPDYLVLWCRRDVSANHNLVTSWNMKMRKEILSCTLFYILIPTKEIKHTDWKIFDVPSLDPNISPNLSEVRIMHPCTFMLWQMSSNYGLQQFVGFVSSICMFMLQWMGYGSGKSWKLFCIQVPAGLSAGRGCHISCRGLKCVPKWFKFFLELLLSSHDR